MAKELNNNSRHRDRDQWRARPPARNSKLTFIELIPIVFHDLHIFNVYIPQLPPFTAKSPPRAPLSATQAIHDHFNNFYS